MKTISHNLRVLLNKYSHAWVFLYAFIYFPWFNWLEKKVTTGYSVIYSPLDSYIPFVEFFIVPYLLWYVRAGSDYFSYHNSLPVNFILK